MVGTQKLLYILPDLAYTAELLQGKKEGEYSVQSFHQINGEFMDDDNLLPENLKKLFEKIEAEEYVLVLPDFLFADTIVSVPNTDDVAIAEYLRSDLLPKIGVSTLTHETKTTILMQRKNESRVQFSALEKEIADLLASVLSGKEIRITGIVPLSWTIKSLVSLEPSISVVQIGTRLYLSEHYVGINQTSNAPLGSVENIVETVTTLKGADPNLQTLYLLTNALVEEKLRDALTKILPVQQLTLPGDDNLQMPSYVKQLIEAAGSTLNDKNYPVPHFSLGSSAVVTSVVAPDEEVAELGSEVQTEEEEVTEEVEPELVEAEVADTEEEAVAAAVEPVEGEVEAETEEEATKPEAEESPQLSETVDEQEVEKAEEKEIEPETDLNKPVFEEKAEKISSEVKVEEDKEDEPTAEDDVKTETQLDKKEPEPDNATHRDQEGSDAARVEKQAKKELSPKRKGRTVGDFFKKLLLFILIFALTIAIGLGVGYGVLKLTGGNTDEPEPTPIPEEVVVEEPVVVATDSADASESAGMEDNSAVEIDKGELSILVVNATGVAGLAGTVRTSLTNDGFTSVNTGNSKGEYSENADLVLMPSKNSALISALEAATGLSLRYDEDYQTEDPDKTYDAVIVLGASR